MSWNARQHDPEWPFDLYATNFDLALDSTALMVIDIQAGSIVKDPESEFGRTHPAIVPDSNTVMSVSFDTEE